MPIDYACLNADIAGLDEERAIVALIVVLPGLWCDDYEDGVAEANPQLIDIGRFRVIFDLTSMGCTEPEIQEDRVIAIFGRSCPPEGARDAVRMRGYLGKTREAFGEGYDKGHFVAHSMGGDVLDSLNWFRQERRLNRGWSAEGRVYRRMERHCAAHPGTFLFSRPIYQTPSARPDVLEFGILCDGRLEFCRFDNRRPVG